MLLISADDMDEKLPEYEFGITSLVDKHEFLQKGDVVQFQIGTTKKGKERATNIKAIRARIQVIKLEMCAFKYNICRFNIRKTCSIQCKILFF